MDLDHFASPFSSSSPDDGDEGAAALPITVNHALDPGPSDEEHLSQLQGREIASEQDESAAWLVARIEDPADRLLIETDSSIVGESHIPFFARVANPLEIAHIWRVRIGCPVRDERNSLRPELARELFRSQTTVDKKGQLMPRAARFPSGSLLQCPRLPARSRLRAHSPTRRHRTGWRSPPRRCASSRSPAFQNRRPEG